MLFNCYFLFPLPHHQNSGPSMSNAGSDELKVFSKLMFLSTAGEPHSLADEK